MRLIDAGRIEKRLLEEEPHDGWDEYYEGFNRMKGIALNAIDATPTIDAVPVVRGEWIHTGITNVYGGHQHKCSVCGYSLMVSPACDNENYCCSCGAKMHGEKHE